MDTESFRATFLDSCNFVRLHGWCDQTNDRIGQLLGLIRENSGIKSDLLSLVNDTLQQVDSLEERLMILVLLAELGVGPDHIAELMYQSLQGKLTNKDSNFIIRHFFHNASPVPEEITYDITKRNFISYQRAIYQALKISGFESEFDAAHILLYLIQLLCRNNLNEQNRAMLYLLLSRIDIELPPAIEHTVSAAMLSLRDVIHEVEQRLESVLSDTLHDNDLSLEEPDWDNPPSAKPSEAQPAAAGNPETLRRIDYQNAKPAAAAETRPIVQTPAEPPGKTYAGSYFDNLAAPGNNPAPAPSAAASAKPAQPPAPVAPAALDRAGAIDAKPTGLDSPAPNPASSNAAADYFATQSSPAIQAAVSDDSLDSEPAAGGESKGPSIFQINFTRETNELKAVLQALKESSGNAEKTKAVEAVFGDQSESGRVPVSAIGRAIFRSKWGLVIVAAVLALLVLGLVWQLTKTGQNPVPAPAQSSAPSPTPATSPAVSTLQASAKPEGNPGGPAPLLKGEARGLVWYPQKGESLWFLYSHIRAGGQTPPELKALAAKEWRDFLAAILAVNPGLAYPDIIFPAKPILIVPAP